MITFARPAERDRRRLRQIGGRRLADDRLGESEVEHFHHAVRSDLDIRRFQIPVDDASLMRGVERIRNLLGDLQ